MSPTLQSARAAVDVDPSAAAKRDANAMSQAFLDGDLETFADYTLPSMFDMAGGRDVFLKALQQMVSEMEGGEYQIVQSTVDDPIQLLEVGDELHAILPQRQIIALASRAGKLHSTGYLLGVSADGGQNWRFIDVSSVSEDQVRTLLPSYKAELKLPTPEPPTFVPD